MLKVSDKFRRRFLLPILALASTFTLISPQNLAFADTLVFSNSDGSFTSWNQNGTDIYLNEITGTVGATITTIKAGWATGITTQASGTTVYIYDDVGGAPTTIAATFSYSSNDGSHLASFTGSYVVPAGGKFFIGERSLSTINNAGGATANQAGTSWSINYTSRYYGTSTSGPFSNQNVNSSPVFLIYTGTTATALSTPAAPIGVANGSTSIGVSETSTTANASSYSIKLFQSDGVTLVDSKSVSTAAITSSTIFSGLTPNTQYKVGVIAVGDGTNYLNSAQSSLTSVVTPLGSTSAVLSISGSPIYYRTSTQIQATVTGTAGVVSFLANGKYIAGCRKLATVSLVATCTWRPSLHGLVKLTAIFNPNSSNYAASTSPQLGVGVAVRSGVR